MRSQNTGAIENVIRELSEQDILEIFKRICMIRYFELNVKKAFDKGLIKMPIYLSVGQESVAAALSLVYPDAAIFGQHRCHDLYLAYGGSVEALIDELLHRPTGCAKGMGGSASIHSPAINMFGHDGLMGTQIPIAVGYAFAKNKRTLAVMGDASAEEDYVLGALGYAAHKKLPMAFVCMDNGLSILTKVAVRRNWKMTDIAAAFGIQAVEITDNPWLIVHHMRKFGGAMPIFMNIHVVRHLWHNGTGVDGPPEWDRFALIKEELQKVGMNEKITSIEEDARDSMDRAWETQLALGTI
ncbi:MAG: hypothetical protein HYT37_03045 [Candidatus Sungbacteria bacterium]|nr:hypothetical protein [Candidatus Sungbacteria bacterium]